MRFLGVEAQYFFPGAEKWRRNFESQFSLSREFHCLFAFASKRMHTGYGTATSCSVASRAPVEPFTVNRQRVSLSAFPTIQKRPSGESEKWRGFFPFVKAKPEGVSFPLIGSTEKTAMLSCPLLEAYTNLPEGCTLISAVVLSPLKSGGNVGTVCRKLSFPLEALY